MAQAAHEGDDHQRSEGSLLEPGLRGSVGEQAVAGAHNGLALQCRPGADRGHGSAVVEFPSWLLGEAEVQHALLRIIVLRTSLSFMAHPKVDSRCDRFPMLLRPLRSSIKLRSSLSAQK